MGVDQASLKVASGGQGTLWSSWARGQGCGSGPEALGCFVISLVEEFLSTVPLCVLMFSCLYGSSSREFPKSRSLAVPLAEDFSKTVSFVDNLSITFIYCSTVRRFALYFSKISAQ